MKDADEMYWRRFLGNRREFIGEVIEMVSDANHDLGTKIRMINALKAARGRSRLITPSLCDTYLRAWRADTSRWRRFVAGFDAPKNDTVRFNPRKVLARLGLNGCSHLHLATT